MKDLSKYIKESLKIGKGFKYDKYEYMPKTKEELEKIINKITEQHKDDKVIDLNMIDTSHITDMNHLFEYNKHQYDISQWNVSKVEDMNAMFFKSEFNQDISRWDVSNVKDIKNIFKNSKFNKDLTKWENKIKNIKQLKYIKKYIH